MKHPCHARGCSKEVPPRLLMCLRHWKLVPRALQQEIWRTYVPGQEVRKDPSDEYMEVQRKCVEAVAAAEGLVVTIGLPTLFPIGPRR